MTYEELKTLPTDKLLSELQTAPKITRDRTGNRNYYEGAHPIVTDPNRADIVQDTYERDGNGDLVKGNDGKPVKSGTRTVTRARLVLSYPKQIVTTKIAMLSGNGVDISETDGANPELFQQFSTIFYEKIKANNLIKEAIKTTAIETDCAVIFFFKNSQALPENLKAKLLSKQNGDDIYPYFDSDGDLIAFTRKFTNKAVVDGDIKEQTVIQAWFADRYIVSTDGVIEDEVNTLGKIPVVYFDQVYPEWKDSKESITSQEYTLSQLKEVNRRIGNPPIVLKGDVTDMGDPAADVKVFKVKTGKDIEGNSLSGGIELLESVTAPESVSLELKTIDKNIERGSWMDLSQLREMAKGTGISGFAMQVALTDAFATRSAQIGVWDDGMMRMISIMKMMLSKAPNIPAYDLLNVSHEYKPLLPEDLAAQTTILTEAVQGGITSPQNAVRKSSINDNPSAVQEELDTLSGGIQQ